MKNTMKKPIVFMFSGQGSQYYQMGEELYDNHPRFRLWMDHCDSIVSPLINESLIDILYQRAGKSEPFDRVLYTNPALICIEYSLARMLMESGIRPDYLLGYSLGEITASIISGAISLEEGLQLAVDFAVTLEQKSPPAEMLAVIDGIKITEEFPELFQECWVTGVNFKKSFVVSGHPVDVQNLQIALKQKMILTQKLPVNYGFHTELMSPLELEFKRLVRQMNISPVRIPTISALESAEITEVTDDYLWRVIRNPVAFEKTIERMLVKDDYVFVDVGPSGTLATFVKYLLPGDSRSSYLETINQFGRDLQSFEKVKAYFSMEAREVA